MIVILCLGVFLILFYSYLKSLLNFWKRKRVAFVNSDIYSNAVSSFYFPTTLFDHYARIHHQLEGLKYGGSFWLFRPQFVVRDPELIKQILVKDFEYFRERGSVFFDILDPVSHNLFTAPGDLWKALRRRLTPTFTSAKIRYMYNTVKECAEEYQRRLENLASDSKPIDVEAISLGYTIQVISSTAFGWKTNSINKPNTEFLSASRNLFRRTWRFKLWLASETWFPYLRKYFKFHMLSKWPRQFFVDIIQETVDHRKKTGYKRNDFLQLLINQNEETNDGSSKYKNTNVNHIQRELRLTTELMTAQSIHFFNAGFEPSSFILITTSLELAVNEDIQRKVQEEIDDAIHDTDETITYTMIESLQYLHKVVQESLRKYPVIPIISRVCEKNYCIPDTSIVIEKGTEVVISIAGIHHDKNIYPNPEVFDPERFSIEEIQKRHHFTFLPFGEGPRNCIGNNHHTNLFSCWKMSNYQARSKILHWCKKYSLSALVSKAKSYAGSGFAFITVKLALVHILSKFNLERTADTVYPMPLQPNCLLSYCKHPVILKCIPRSH